MKQLNWLKQKEVNNGLFEIFIKPDFFDFSKTDCQNGIPLFGGALTKDEVKNIFDKAENYIQDNIHSLIESAEDDGEKPVNYLTNSWNNHSENFFVMYYTDIDIDKEKAFFYPRMVLPYVNHDDHIFNHGIAISGRRSYAKEINKSEYNDLNNMLLDITKKHLSLIEK